MIKSGKLRILIVEDDFKSRMLLQKMLSTHALCDIVINGDEAVEAFNLALEDKNSYDLICMDIMMPGMDGKEALKKIRLIEKEKGFLSAQRVKIFMITALDTENDILESIKNKCTDYLIKPIEKKKLVEKLKQHDLL